MAGARRIREEMSGRSAFQPEYIILSLLQYVFSAFCMGAIESIFSEIDVSEKEKEDLHFMSLATKLQGQFLSRLEIILLLRLLCLFRLLSLNTARIRRARLVLSIKVVISLS